MEGHNYSNIKNFVSASASEKKLRILGETHIQILTLSQEDLDVDLNKKKSLE